MIAFRDHIPLIVLPNGIAVAFDRDWLARALSVAAHRSGYAKWWLSVHVAESVHVWLKTLSDETVLPVKRLTEAVRSALQVIGYEEIGDRFEASAPFARISLVEIAQQAGDCFELGFFPALRRKLEEVLGMGGSYCELTGLEPCVKLLQHRKAWSRDCEALRGEIVRYARAHSEIARGPHQGDGARELFLYVS
jgi:hypothetical protein